MLSLELWYEVYGHEILVSLHSNNDATEGFHSYVVFEHKKVTVVIKDLIGATRVQKPSSLFSNASSAVQMCGRLLPLTAYLLIWDGR